MMGRTLTVTKGWATASRPQEAVTEYLKASELDPTFSDVYVNQASAQLSLGDYAAARASYERFLELHVQEDEVRHQVCLLYTSDAADE